VKLNASRLALGGDEFRRSVRMRLRRIVMQHAARDLNAIAEAYAAMDERRAIKSLVRVGDLDWHD
jgi:hypothetical protein